MQIKIKEISKEKLKKNGWEYLYGLQLCRKTINECMVCVRPLESELPFECYIPVYENPTPEDLIAIGEELKKLEE